MKRLTNTSKTFVLVIVKAKDIDKYYYFHGCDTSYKNEFVKFISNYEDIFKEPEGFPPKREIQHEIQLQ